MRQRCWWRTLAVSASFAFTGGSTAAFAQDHYGESYAEPTPAAAEQSSAELRQILDRLERQERELNSLRSMVNEKTPAKETSLSADAATAAADEKAGTGPCKKIDIISKPNFSVFGRLYFDQIMYEDDPALVAATGVDRLNETGFSTARLGAKGNVYENVIGQIEVEFEGTETDFKDVYIEANALPYLGNLRVGHFKEPFSLSEMTSNKYHTFMNREAINGIVPSRNFGLMAYDYIAENDNWSWFAGTFRNDSPDNPTARASHIADEGDWVFTGRLAGLLFYDEPSGGRYLWHVGSAYSHRDDLTVVSFAQRNELGSQAGYLTQTFTGDDTWDMYNLETAVVWGPSSVQAEYIEADTGAGIANGGYVEATYFLTGEHRAYKKDIKAFDRVKPLEDFFRVSTADGVCMGRGAWQLKARYSWLDMTDGPAGVRGNYNGFSAGANWHWNPYTRMMFDYVHEDVNLITGVDGANDNFGMRLMFDF